MEAKKKGGKKNRKYGRGVKKGALYRQRKQREKNKLARILRSNGRATAEAYASKHDLRTYFARRFPVGYTP